MNEVLRPAERVAALMRRCEKVWNKVVRDPVSVQVATWVSLWSEVQDGVEEDPEWSVLGVYPELLDAFQGLRRAYLRECGR